MIWLLLYIIPCIAFAKINSNWTKYKVDWAKGKKIKHFWNGLLHLTVAVTSWFIFHQWQAPVIVILLARLVFDTAYYLFMGHSIDYVTLTPKSITDKVEQFFFKKDGITPKIIYLLLLIILFTV